MITQTRIARWLIITLVSLTALMGLGFSASINKPEELPDIFAHHDITVETDQIIGKIMVAGGNAVVGGKVTDSVLVVDGNLVIQQAAKINGHIVVLGGSATIEPGAAVNHRPWVIAPKGHPLVPLIVSALLILGAISLLVFPALFWFVGHLCKKTSWYIPAKNILLAIEQRWPILYIAVSLFISALMLLAFSALAWETLFQKTMVLFDDSFVWLFRYFANPTLDKIMIRISDIGFGTSYIIMVIISFLLLTYLKRWRELGALMICLTGAAALSFLLKNLFQRPRPDVFRVVQEVSYSFPSGHAMASMCFYGMIVFLMMRTIPSWRGRLTVMTLAVALSVAIGISRIYLGVHYPSDVVAGYAAGSMWVAFCISLLMWWEQDRKENE